MQISFPYQGRLGAPVALVSTASCPSHSHLRTSLSIRSMAQESGSEPAHANGKFGGVTTTSRPAPGHLPDDQQGRTSTLPKAVGSPASVVSSTTNSSGRSAVVIVVCYLTPAVPHAQRRHDTNWATGRHLGITQSEKGSPEYLEAAIQTAIKRTKSTYPGRPKQTLHVNEL